jgi:hypothetical protein
MSQSSATARGVATASSYVALACAMGLFLAALFSDARTGGAVISIGATPLDYHSVRGPFFLLLVLFTLHTIFIRPDWLAVAGRVAGGRYEPADERMATRVVWVLVAFGFLLRIARVGAYGLSPDESWFVWFGASDSIADLWAYEKSVSPHPPGPFLLLHALTSVSWDLLWLRLPNVLAGTWLIWVCHRLSRNLFGLAAGVGMAGLVAFAPALVELSRVSRNYAPAFLLTVGAVHYFERFLQSERWRDFLIYSLLAPLAVAFHYLVIVVFVALDLILLGRLASRRRPIGSWVRAGLCQLPLAGLAGFLYVEHLRALPHRVAFMHREWYEDLLILSPLQILNPLAGIWDYILWGWGAWLFAILTIVGLSAGLLNGKVRGCVICVVPVAIAYLLAAVGVLPVGDTRHSSYLFPFLFLLVASQVEDLSTGYVEAWRRLKVVTSAMWSRIASGPSRDEAVPSPIGASVDGSEVRLSRAGVAAGLLITTLFLHHSLQVYSEDVEFEEPLRKGRPVRELTTWYRQRDIDAAFRVLRERAGENDIVILGLQGLLLLRTHFEMSPLVAPTLKQVVARDIRLANPGKKPLVFESDGVRYYFSTEARVRLDPTNISAALNEIQDSHQIEEPDRVWVLRGGWDYAMADIFRRYMPNDEFDRDADRQTNGVLFGMETAALRDAGWRFGRLVSGILELERAEQAGDDIP